MVWFVCQASRKCDVGDGGGVFILYQGIELGSERENGAFTCTLASEGKNSHVITYRVSCLSTTSLPLFALLHPHPKDMDSAYQLQPIHSNYRGVTKKKRS